MKKWGVKLWSDEYVEVEAETESEAIQKAKYLLDFPVSDAEAEEIEPEE